MFVHVPPAVANQSWRAIAIVTALAAAGALALYSMAGGSVTPWAGAHLLRFTLFLGLALIISYIPSWC